MVTSEYVSRTAWHGCTLMLWSNNSQDSTWTPCDACAGVVRAPHGNLRYFSYPTGPARDPQRCLTAPLRTRKRIDTARICENPAQASYVAVRGPYGPLMVRARAVHGLFTISKPVRDPSAYNACIMGRQNSHGTTRDPYGPQEWTHSVCSKQSENSPYGIRD